MFIKCISILALLWASSHLVPAISIAVLSTLISSWLNRFKLPNGDTYIKHKMSN